MLFGLDEHKTLFQQYCDYWVMLFHGNLGSSFSKGLVPVGEVFANALPWTIGLVGIATIISFTIGTLLGAWIGWRRGSKADAIIPISTFFSTVPYFWMGLIAISFFSNTLHWLPASHAYDKGVIPNLSFDFIGQVISHVGHGAGVLLSGRRQTVAGCHQRQGLSTYAGIVPCHHAYGARGEHSR